MDDTTSQTEQADGSVPGPPARGASVIVYCWLVAMGTLTLAMAAVMPAWAEHQQALAVRKQLQDQLTMLAKRVEKNDYYIRSYLDDPEALDLLAISDLRYRRPDEFPVPLPGQVADQVRPLGWQDDARLRESLGEGASGAPARANQIQRVAERAYGCTVYLLGPRRTSALIEAFCDPTSRQALTMAALGVLAAALFIGNPKPAPAEQRPS